MRHNADMALMMDVAAANRSVVSGWLRNPDFDTLLICGLTALALSAGLLIALQPLALPLVLLADNWLLGYPHVIATFTRIAPDRATMRLHRFTLFVLPVLVVAATAALVIGVGITLVATIYFYWQWYHTVRQSWGIAQLYRRKAKGRVLESPQFAEALFVLVPLWGLLHRLTKAPDHFLYPNLPIWVPPVPTAVADAAGIVACAGLAVWVLARAREFVRGELPLLHTLFSASHYVVFIVGYIIMDDVSGGWVVTNIWHTGQYLMLVWLFNENAVRAADGGWFKRATSGNRAAPYFLLCLLVSFVVYMAINRSFAWGPSALVFAIIANQTLNFHHFITDALIWRSRRSPTGSPA
jgi:hypothetical protein